MAVITFKNVNKIYSNNVQAVFDFCLKIKDKQFVALVGPSGCGKSTTLRMIAGLEEISSGEVYINNRLVNNVEPKDRGIAMVFQNYALYPHMSVKDNMSFALEMRKKEVEVLDQNGDKVLTYNKKLVKELEKSLKQHKKDSSEYIEILIKIDEVKSTLDTPATRLVKYSKDEINEKVNKAAEILGLTNYLNKKPRELSGGQRQRVALGRALVRDADVFLMDEPLSNLDAKLRASMRNEIKSIHKKVGATTIYVTHDQVEAMTMADVIVIMKDGFVQQIGSPTEVFNDPNNLFVAGFIGTPQMNIIDGTISDSEINVLGCKIKSTKTYFNKIKKFYEEKLAELKSEVEELNVLIEQKPKVSSKKKKELVNNPLTYENQLNHKQEEIKQIEEIVNGKKYPIKFGVRPDDIYFANDSENTKPSPLFTMKQISYELLGHDVIIHAQSGHTDVLISKAVKAVDLTNEKLELCFDLNTVYIFDPITGLRLRKE